MADDLFTAEQREDLDFFWENLDKFAQDPLLHRKQVVIHHKQIVGAYDTVSAAGAFALRHYPQGQFVIQEVIRDDETVGFYYPAVV